MRSSNPVFTRRGFSRDGGYAGFNAGPQPQTGTPYAGSPSNPYAQPGNPYAQPQVGPDGSVMAPGAPTTRPGVMTIDSVVSRTALTLGTVIVAAAVAWITDLPSAPVSSSPSSAWGSACGSPSSARPRPR